MGSAELVSVVIPVYNGVRFLAEAIGSVCAQQHRPLEIIVVDDGSTDGSADVARSFPGVHCLRQANGGIAAARNAGIQQATGTLLAFLDADDVWAPEKLARQLAALELHPDAQFVSGGIEQFFDGVAADSSAQPPPAMNTTCAGSILIRTRDFRQVGLLNPALRVGEFIDWYSRALSLGLRELRLEQIVLRRRIHGANTTLVRRASSVDYLAVLKAHLERKRRAA